MELIFNIYDLKWILSILAIISGIFVISTKNAVISVFNLIVLYILVAFYLIYIGITYMGISYIIIYIGAIAILFLFVIMMIDIEVLEIKSNNYIPLLFILLLSFLILLKNILYSLGLVKIKSENKVSQSELFINDDNLELFNLRYINSIIINNYYRSYENINMKEIEFNVYNNDSIIFQEYYKKFSDKKDEIYLESFKFIPDNNSWVNKFYPDIKDNNYLLIIPNWDSAVSRISQISAIGDLLYTVYHSYIYIVSVILLLGMIGAIILTADTHQEVKVMTLKKMSSLSFISSISYFTKYLKKNKINAIGIPSFFELLNNNNNKHSEDIIGNLIYFIIANIVIGLLLLFINSYFSLSVKYLEKGGGFECGFTSFVQTRERFNVIFYRVSLLFLVFDLEIILAFPYPAIYQKNQIMSKNNVLAFLYILIVGFIYELKEGALNIVKKAHNTEISKEN